MLTQTEARIYLQDQRGYFQSEGFRSFRNLNFGEYQDIDRQPIGSLLCFNDETLMPECAHSFQVAQAYTIVLVPLVGAIEIGLGRSKSEFADSGEAFTFNAKPDETYRITNPYPDRAVNYLQIRLDLSKRSLQNRQLTHFDLTQKNVLMPVCDVSAENRLSIGKYEGREEGVYFNDNPTHPIFIFIIEGAFEVQNRLLEKRDALVLWNAEEVEFEALSTDAVILMISV